MQSKSRRWIDQYLRDYAREHHLSLAAAQRLAVYALRQQELERLAREDEEGHLPIFVPELAFPT